jgi:DNA-binding MarR family transcriptional regulator
MILLQSSHTTQILYLLEFRPCSTLLEIAKFLNRSNTSTNMEIRRLLKQKFINRTGIRRKYQYYLTPMGLTLLNNFKDMKYFQEEDFLCN